jgi:glycosyltransferase involved in cell wall biosynthesis
MSEAPRVSIVTPTWNRAALLERTIASLRTQTFRDFEHIVVDGASTDDTAALLTSLEGEYPTMTDARNARNTMPGFLRGHRP